MFRGYVRRSGSLRSIWHRRERKRRPAEPLTTTALVVPPPPVFCYTPPSEAEWQSGQPNTMLHCLVRLATERGLGFHMTPRAVERKLRLFYCACCRLRWDALPMIGRHAVEVIEQYADGLVNAQKLRGARRTAERVLQMTRPLLTGAPATSASAMTLRVAELVVTAGRCTLLRDRYVPCGAPVGDVEQGALLRELFENPFRPIPVAREWGTPTVVTLARVIRAERAFELMPVLGDALQDAGCDRSEILEHCYGPGPHAAGCWLVDRLSGRDTESPHARRSDTRSY